MKRFFVNATAAYADAGSGTGTALTPDMLSPGSIGIYGFNNNKIKLSTTGADLAGATEVIIAMGTANGGPVVSQPLPKSAVTGSAATAGTTTAQKTYIGFNGTTGSLNLPTIVDGDWGEVKIVRTTHGVNQRIDKDSFEVSNLTAGTGPYDVINGIALAILARSKDLTFLNHSLVVTNATLASGSVFSNTATAAVTNGSVSVTTSAAHGVTVGNYVSFTTNNGTAVYKVVAVPTTTTLTLDKPYAGSTNSAIANAATYKTATAPTNGGLAVVSESPLISFKVAVSGVLEDAVIDYSVPSVIGSGDGLYAVLPEEKAGQAYTGYHDKLDTRVKTPGLFTVTSKKYNVFRLAASPSYASKDEMSGKFNTKYEVGVAFDYNGGSDIDAQTKFETVVNAFFGTSLSA